MGKVVDFKSKKVEKITKEELDELQQMVHVQNKINSHLGSLELEKFNALKAFEESEIKMAELRDSLRTKYGDVNISIQDGSIKEAENGTDKKN